VYNTPTKSPGWEEKRREIREMEARVAQLKSQARMEREATRHVTRGKGLSTPVLHGQQDTTPAAAKRVKPNNSSKDGGTNPKHIRTKAKKNQRTLTPRTATKTSYGATEGTYGIDVAGASREATTTTNDGSVDGESTQDIITTTQGITQLFSLAIADAYQDIETRSKDTTLRPRRGVITSRKEKENARIAAEKAELKRAQEERKSVRSNSKATKVAAVTRLSQKRAGFASK
jgi:hypothetical protein